MKSQFIVSVLYVAGVAGACSETKSKPDAAPAVLVQRIVSLTPSTTELVVALGARDHLVGVDRYSVLPADGKPVAVVGDYLAPDVEAIAALRPDLVILDAAQERPRGALDAAGFKTLAVELHTTRDVLRATEKIGGALGKAEATNTLIKTLDARALAFLEATATLPRKPRALFVIDRQPGAISGLVAAGPGSYAHELLELAGAVNAVPETLARYPKLSAEDLLRLEPELIFETVPKPVPVAAEWSAVKWPNGRTPEVMTVDAPYFMAPSPRFPEAVEILQVVVRRVAALPPPALPPSGGGM